MKKLKKLLIPLICLCLLSACNVFNTQCLSNEHDFQISEAYLPNLNSGDGRITRTCTRCGATKTVYLDSLQTFVENMMAKRTAEIRQGLKDPDSIIIQAKAYIKKGTFYDKFKRCLYSKDGFFDWR